MKRPELFAMFREQADDEALPHLWRDTEVQRYLDDAVREAAERALLIRDTTTTAVCQVAVVAGTAAYTLHDSIVEVTRAQLVAERYPLVLTSTEEMDRDHPGWTALTVQTPSRLVLDPEGRTLRALLSPPPVANGTLALQVYRTPLESVASDDDEPEIPRRYHAALVDWMLYRAYAKPDSETHSDLRAAAAAERFTRAFGAQIDANVRRKQRDRAPSVVRFVEY